MLDIHCLGGDPMHGDITQLLQRHRSGDRDAFDRMVPIVYERLRAIAHRQLLRAGPRERHLNTTALVHETYLQMVGESGVDWQDRAHFFAVCALAMRRVLVDYARQRQAAKRGGGVADLTLEPGLVAMDAQSELVLAVDQALQELESFNAKLARVVECRYFAGMTEEETAEALHSSVRTVQRDWTRARAWLSRALA